METRCSPVVQAQQLEQEQRFVVVFEAGLVVEAQAELELAVAGGMADCLICLDPV